MSEIVAFLIANPNVFSLGVLVLIMSVYVIAYMLIDFEEYTAIMEIKNDPTLDRPTRDAKRKALREKKGIR